MSLPPGTWYDYYSGVSTFSSTEQVQLPVPTKLYQLPVFMRGGSVIIMYQGLTGTNSMKVRIVYLELRCKSKFTSGVSVRASVLDKQIGMKFT